MKSKSWFVEGTGILYHSKRDDSPQLISFRTGGKPGSKTNDRMFHIFSDTTDLEWLQSLCQFTEKDFVRTISTGEFPGYRVQVTGLTSGQEAFTKEKFSFRNLSKGMKVFVAAMLGFVAVVFFLVPKFSEKVAQKVPVEVEQNLFSKFSSPLDSEDSKVDSCACEEGQKHLEDLVARFKKRLPELKGLNVQLKVEKNRDVNAYAHPGGLIVLNSGFLEEARSSGEVAGILAHEMAHLAKRHVLSSLIKNLSLQVLLGLGDKNGGSQVGEWIGLSYSRGAEAEADAVALRILNEEGISTKGMIDFFKRQKEKNKNKKYRPSSFFSTHPSDDERIKALESASAPIKSKGTIWSEEDFSHLKNTCRYHPNREYSELKNIHEVLYDEFVSEGSNLSTCVEISSYEKDQIRGFLTEGKDWVLQQKFLINLKTGRITMDSFSNGGVITGTIKDIEKVRIRVEELRKQYDIPQDENFHIRYDTVAREGDFSTEVGGLEIRFGTQVISKPYERKGADRAAANLFWTLFDTLNRSSADSGDLNE